jgi:regulator of sirC expression with transglutaminase-like and TPR domain
VLERLVVLLPQTWEERRDRGIAYADLGDDAAAACDLTLYLEHVPDAHDRQAIAERLAHLGRTGSSSAPPRLH